MTPKNYQQPLQRAIALNGLLGELDEFFDEKIQRVLKKWAWTKRAERVTSCFTVLSRTGNLSSRFSGQLLTQPGTKIHFANQFIDRYVEAPRMFAEILWEIEKFGPFPTARKARSDSSRNPRAGMKG